VVERLRHVVKLHGKMTLAGEVVFHLTLHSWYEAFCRGAFVT
jgi:hypothetical protein